MFSGAQDFRTLAHVFRGPKVLDPGSCFQRPRFFGSWLMFLEDQGFLDPDSCFQRRGIFESWLKFFRGPSVFWDLAHVFRGPKVLDPGSCFQRPRIFGSWLMFLEDQGFFRLWLMFSGDQRFWILDYDLLVFA